MTTSAMCHVSQGCCVELVSAMCHVFQGCCLELIHDVCSVSRVSGVLPGISTCRCLQSVTYHMGVVMYQYMSMRAVCYVSEGRSFELVHVDACSVSRITWVLSCISTCRCLQCVVYVFHGCCITRSKHLNA